MVEDTAERIAHKELLLFMKRNMVNILRDAGQEELAIEEENSIKELLESINHDRAVQKIEASVSGRKKWWEDDWKYALVFIGGAILIKIIDFLLASLT